MATNKHATIRYQALDKCFRNNGRRFFIEDLIEACNEAVTNFDPQCGGVNKRQVQYDIVFMESESGWSVPLGRHKDQKRVFYRYDDPDFSINKQPLNENEKTQLREALLTLSRFKGMPQFEWIDEMIPRLESGLGLKSASEKVIEFDENPFLRGIEHITPIYDAIINRQTLMITYNSYKPTDPFSLIFHPYYLKQYNNRWFVFGLNDEYKNIQNLALDRVVEIQSAETTYIENNQIDFSEYFEDIVGVSVYTEKQVEKILILVSHERWPYIESKPLHGSQKKKKVADDGVLIEIEVIPNMELDALLLSHGGFIEVISPAGMRVHFTELTSRMAGKYLSS
jgi:predicted DNA-binding transcriptional regulator YafY